MLINQNNLLNGTYVWGCNPSLESFNAMTSSTSLLLFKEDTFHFLQMSAHGLPGSPPITAFNGGEDIVMTS